MACATAAVIVRLIRNKFASVEIVFETVIVLEALEH